jgi:class 3 adenylate cyclase
MGTMSRERKRLGETNDPLELAVLGAMGERSSGTLMGATRPPQPPERIVGFYRIHEAPWTILLFARGETILAPLVRFRNYYAAALTLSVLSILVLIRSVGGKTVRSIRDLSRAAEQIAQGHYANILPTGAKDEIGQLMRSFNTMVDGLVERDFISNTFGRYVDPEIARELLRRPEAGKLGGQKREVAILMSDIRGFTALSESLSPEATINILNRYFSRMIDVIQHHRGIIVDFFGDAVLVFFDPLEGPIEGVVRRAIQCALEMQEAMAGFNEQNRSDGLPELQMGVGVHAGEVVVGNVGSETRAKYGIVGSPVNVTQRIQETANGGEVIVSDPVYHHANEDLVVKRVVETPLKGIQDRVTLYVVEGLRDPPLMRANPQEVRR